ncbi:hypothetical protein [Streptomyces kanamyceticus]|uniref:Peptidoglycan-binding protein n=1 Tax=Streptomyces kanamyceticus TaxID=1967 RepID=A0A5J6GQ32_STRKN|nr:hypothetical protein [Streptomyces kanamyceticus]QEU96231.1 hypothetical protein CP970_39605 [Streptomyces kanamyceticus]
MEPRRRTRWLAYTAVGAVLAVTGTTWALAAQARTPAQLAADASAPPKSRITVPVKVETLVRSVAVECTVKPSTVLPVPIPAGESSGGPEGDAVVTALPLARGREVAEGKVVAEISGRPVIALAGRLPAYRDLTPGATGPDVAQLQRALVRIGLLEPGTPSRVFDTRTQRALAGLYRDRGYPAPHGKDDTDEAVAARGELLFVPRLPGRMGTVSSVVGGPARPGELTVEAGQRALHCPVQDDGAARKIRSGATATVVAPDGSTARGRVEPVPGGAAAAPSPGPSESPSEGASEEASEGAEDKGDAGTSDPEIVVRTPKEPTLKGSYQVRVEVDKAPARGPVVPSSALWSRPGGTTVVKVVRGGTEREIRVVPVFEVEGEAAVRDPRGALRAGDKVVVSDVSGQGGSS